MSSYLSPEHGRRVFSFALGDLSLFKGSDVPTPQQDGPPLEQPPRWRFQGWQIVPRVGAAHLIL